MTASISVFVASAQNQSWAEAQAHLLSTAERARWRSWPNQSLQAMQYLLSRVLRRRALQLVTGVEAHSWQFLTDALGLAVPFAQDAQKPPPAASLSHSRGHVVVAVGHVPCLGIDVESPSRFDDARARAVKLMRLVLTPKERQRIEALPQAAWPRAFVQQWALKEAACKAVGQGLRGPWREVAPDVPLGPLGVGEWRCARAPLKLPEPWARAHLGRAPLHVGLLHTGGARPPVVALAVGQHLGFEVRCYQPHPAASELLLI